LRRRWCPRGARPPWVVDDRYAWLWLYAAVEPATGGGYFLLLPGVSKEWFALFLRECGRALAGRRVGLVLDGAGSHRAAVAWPTGVVPVPLPPSSPELNPAEQVFRSLRATLANRVFADLPELEAALTEKLRAFWDRPATLRRLTADPWWTRPASTLPSTP
jgi:transposase